MKWPSFKSYTLVDMQYNHTSPTYNPVFTANLCECLLYPIVLHSSMRLIGTSCLEVWGAWQ